MTFPPGIEHKKALLNILSDNGRGIVREKIVNLARQRVLFREQFAQAAQAAMEQARDSCF